jgi:hypothetical protein
LFVHDRKEREREKERKKRGGAGIGGLGDFGLGMDGGIFNC